MRFAAGIGSPQPQEPCREEAVETGNRGPAEIEIGGRGADRAVGAMNESAPATSPGRTGSSAKSGCPARKAATSSSPSAGSSEQLEKTMRPPGFTIVAAARQQARLQVGELGDVFRRFRPGHVRMAAHRAGRRAGRVEQHRVEQRRPARISACRPRPCSPRSRSRSRFLAEPLQPVSRRIEGRHLGAGQRELRRLAAGRGAEIGDTLAGDIAEQPGRQACGRILHPPFAVGVAWQVGNRARRAARHAPSRSASTMPPKACAQRAGSDFTVKSTGASTRCAARIACAFTVP